jgi:hypothetical protein
MDEVLHHGRTIIVQRKNHTIAEIVPRTTDTTESNEARRQKIDRLYGCMRYLSDQEVETWIHQRDDMEKEYDERLKQLWRKN